MDRFGASLGASLGNRYGSGPQAAPSARLPQLGQAVATSALALPMFQPMPQFGQQLGTRLVNMPDDGLSMFGRLMGKVYGPSGYDAIAAAFGQQIGGQVGAAFDPGSSGLGGQWQQAAGDINAAAAKWGVPANYLAAVINRESSGDWSRDGGRHAWLGARGYGILPYVGMTDPAVRQFGVDPASIVGNRGAQVDLLARNLRRIFDQYGDWGTVANVHYSGDPSGRSTPKDSFQYGTTGQSTNMIMDFWRRLEPNASLSAGAGYAAGGGLGSIETMLGGASPRISQEFGLTDFAKGHLGGMYAYATRYGVQGHAGLDISLNPGTQQFSPVSGTVIIAGGSGYYTDSRYGNRAGTGELRIKLDNGDEVILGHLGSIGVRVGQRVNVGDLVGLSGTNNGGHTHLEYRKYTPGATASGYTAIDPRVALTGMGGTMGQPAPPTSTFGSSMADAARLVWDAGLRNQLLAQG
jgi:hypothetical protein